MARFQTRLDDIKGMAESQAQACIRHLEAGIPMPKAKQMAMDAPPEQQPTDSSLMPWT
jgi:hypothetical protein